MKNLMILLFAVVLIIGCKANQNKPDCDSWRDRLVDPVQQGSLKSDTIKFQRALALSDSVLSVDTTTDNRRFCYYNRSIILNSLGRTEEGWKNKELEMLTLPENNLERLLFMAIKMTRNTRRIRRSFSLIKLCRFASVCWKRNLMKTWLSTRSGLCISVRGEVCQVLSEFTGGKTS